MTAIAAIVLVGVALAVIARPLFARATAVRVRGAAGGLPELEERYRNALADIQDAQNDWEIGNLSEADYTRFREEGRRRAAEALRDISVYTEQREQVRSRVERELADLAALRGAPATEPAGVAPSTNGHVHIPTATRVPRPAARTGARAYVLGGGLAAALAVAGIVFLYQRAVGVQEAQAPVGAIPAPLPSAAIVDASGSFWVARSSGLMQSADGHSWQAVGPTDELAGIATKNGVPWLSLGPVTSLVSTDGGSTWNPTDAPRGAVVGVQDGPDGAYAYVAASAGSAGGLFRTQDGQHWDQVAEAIPERVVGFAIAPGSQGGQILYLATANGVARSVDGGRTWSAASGAVSLALNGIVSDIAADPTRPILYAATSDGLYRTTKDGNEWERLPFKGSASVVAARGDRVLAIDENGHVYVSKSGGVSWTAD